MMGLGKGGLRLQNMAIFGINSLDFWGVDKNTWRFDPRK